MSLKYTHAILVKIFHSKPYQLHGGAIGKVRRSPQQLGFIPLWISVPDIMAIHPKVAEIFQSGPVTFAIL